MPPEARSRRRLPLANGRSLDLTPGLVMGILNATPDSFSDGGEIDDPWPRARRIEEMLEAGVDIIDVGGESTRPGHSPVSAEEELLRVLPLIGELRERSPDIPVSIDTRKARVAEAALDAGVSLVNDVSGLDDDEMGAVVAEAGCAYVAMRSRDCVGPIIECCRRQLADVVGRARAAGIADRAVIVDPGLGFGMRPGASTVANLELIDRVGEYSDGRPVLMGPSRKRFVRAISARTDQDVSTASVGVAVRAVGAGAAIVRVHDVEETVNALVASGLRSTTE